MKYITTKNPNHQPVNLEQVLSILYPELNEDTVAKMEKHGHKFKLYFIGPALNQEDSLDIIWQFADYEYGRDVYKQVMAYADVVVL
jgi:hypothetical protein